MADSRRFEVLSVPGNYPGGCEWWYLVDVSLPGTQPDQVVAVWKDDLEESEGKAADMYLLQHMCDCGQGWTSPATGIRHPDSREWHYLNWDDRSPKNQERCRHRHWLEVQEDLDWMDRSTIPEVMHYLRRQELLPVPRIEGWDVVGTSV